MNRPQVRSAPVAAGSRRSGMTLVEILVVVAVIVIILGLTIPAVMQAREASRRMGCQNKLKQLGLALGQFQSANGNFPPAQRPAPGRDYRLGGDAYSPQTMLLPYLDQAALYNERNDRTAQLTHLNVFICPTESSPLVRGITGPTSYRANIGPSPYFSTGSSNNSGGVENNPGGGGGAFDFLDFIGPSAFTDGLSNTAMMSERLMGSGNSSRLTAGRDVWCLGWMNSQRIPPGDELIRLCQQLPSPNPPHVSTGGETWLYAGFRWTWYNHAVPPNWRGYSCTVDGCDSPPETSSERGGIYGAGSGHSGGVNVLLGDGSVRFIKDTVQFNIWRGLSTRAGAEPTDASMF